MRLPCHACGARDKASRRGRQKLPIGCEIAGVTENPQLVAQGAQADAEKAGGMGAIAMHTAKRLEDGHTLQLGQGQREANRHAVGIFAELAWRGAALVFKAGRNCLSCLASARRFARQGSDG